MKIYFAILDVSSTKLTSSAPILRINKSVGRGIDADDVNLVDETSKIAK